MKRMIALIVCVAVLLCGCGAKNALGLPMVVKFEDMVYVRPDMDEIEDAALAAMEAGENARKSQEVLDAVWEFYEVYESFLTAYDLTWIRYQANLNDIYWEGEYEYCAELAPEVDMYLEDLYYSLAGSPHRAALEEEYFGEGWFDDYEGESWYDDALLTLLEQEQVLMAEYFDLTAAGQELEPQAFYDEYATPMAELLGELTLLRQQIARESGYDSYTDFAWDYYYDRDYTPEQAADYLAEIEALVPLYERVTTAETFAPGGEYCPETAVYDYVKTTAETLGGVAWEAFRLMDQGELCDISASPDKSGMSFELYFYEYAQPYILISGTGSRYDCLTFAHEFGHFATDYAAGGSVAGIDVLEIFSQAMELLSLDCVGAEEAFVEMKLADCLCTYVEQAAYAAFELALYDLPQEEITGENILAIYEEICTEYGFAAMDWDSRDLVTVPHFYSNPLYIISYVVSNDAAVQIYQQELENPGAGRDTYRRSLATEQEYFLAFLEEAELTSPFGRVEDVKAFLTDRLG